MNKKIFYSISIILLLQLSEKLYSQNNTYPYNAPRNLIGYVNNQMESQYGTPFLFGTYFIMDSVIIESKRTDVPYAYTNEVFEDPYNTLDGISIYSGVLDDNFSNHTIVGIIKDGEILWDSGPIIYGNIDENLDFCKDINKDGMVDIGIVADYSDFSKGFNPNNTTKYLWILSWDESNGLFINDYDANTGKSKLEPGYFNLYDQQGDGIYEISTMYFFNEDYTHTPPENPPPNYPYVSYGWNGSKYGLWPGVYQLQEGDYYPAIWIKPEINCSVTLDDDNLFKFEYIVKNDSGSVQKISNIYLVNISADAVVARSDLQANRLTELYESIVPNSWAFRPSSRSFYGLIEPGGIRTEGYWYRGNGLPGICDVHFQALIPVEFTRGSSTDALIESILLNSIKKQTIGLKAIPYNIESNEFLDTLITYTDSSYFLGWIENEGILNSLQVKLNNAKKQLEKNKTKQTINLLNAFVNEVEAQNEKKLTSEAYALLKYNAEYLIEQLSD